MKTKILIVPAILVVSGVYFSVPAFAAPIQVRVCPRIAANFGDTAKLPPDAANDVWGFHYSDNTVEKRLFGTKIRVYQITGPGSAVTLYNDYTAMNDGCTDEFTADSTVTYEIDLWPIFWHREKNLKLHVMTVTPGDTGRYYHPTKRQAQLQAGANVVKGFPASDAWDAYLALHLGLANITLGLQNQDLKAYLDEGCWEKVGQNYQHNGQISCAGSDRAFSSEPYENVLHLAPSSRGNSTAAFIILHELGHLMLSKFVGKFPKVMTNYNLPYAGALGGVKCDYPSFASPGPISRPHGWNSMENNAVALNEAWAHFYAAAVLNRGRLTRAVDDTQCKFVYYKNVDLDDAVDAMGDPTTDQVPPDERGGVPCSGCRD